MQHFVDVILPIPLERLFTYRLTKGESDSLRPGMRVAVPFGKSKIYTGLAHTLHSKPPTAYEAKEIDRILDEQPLVNTFQLRHWQWIADYYMCSLGEVFRSAFPNALLLESETLVLPNSRTEVAEDTLEDDEFLVYEALQHQSSLKVQEVAAIIDRKNALPVLNRLLEKKVILLKEELYEQYKPKMIRYVRFAEAYGQEHRLEELLSDLQRAPKQTQTVLALFQLKAATDKPIKMETLERFAGGSKSAIKALLEKGALEEYFIQTDRVTYKGEPGTLPRKTLNEWQQRAMVDIEKSFERNKVTLLQGVTSSGKTEIYVKYIEKCLEEGRQALYLLPEIALTTQLISRLQGYFGERISVYHSKYNALERVEVWQNVLQLKSKAQIILGARSSLFLPFSNLGLIIIDEEHESSFKQFDPAPRYHARDAAIVLGTLHGSQVLLGSATPSIESFHNVQQGKYGYAHIERRYGNVLMPEMELIDLKEQYRKRRMHGHFSERLKNGIAEALELGEQVILFQNRRGYAPIVECTTCGHSPQCPNCDVSLTYHRHKKQMRCHYCGHHTALPEVCPACGSPTLDTKGFGTEQVERELETLFPDARAWRMDLDTTRGKHAYEKIITAFEQQEIDILVGTQMLAKGLDFRNVGLVGVMQADSLLNFPDYRAHERCFQLLTQVAGRAGRTDKRGTVLIQSYNPYHQILKQVTTHSYRDMYEEQLYQRRIYRYPPITKIIKITLKHRDFNKLKEAALWFSKSLRNALGQNVLGPEPPPVSRIRNHYLQNILVKVDTDQSLGQTKRLIRRIAVSFHAAAPFRSVRVIYDVDHI